MTYELLNEALWPIKLFFVIVIASLFVSFLLDFLDEHDDDDGHT